MAGQNRIYTPYMTVYLAISLPKIPCVHRVHMVVANPRYIALPIISCVKIPRVPRNCFQNYSGCYKVTRDSCVKRRDVETGCDTEHRAHILLLECYTEHRAHILFLLLECYTEHRAHILFLIL